MLPLWRDHLKIALTRNYLSMVRFSGGFHPKITGKTLFKCKQNSSSSWGPAVDTLRGFITRWKNKPANVTIILSNEFARYVMLPWSNQLENNEDEQAFARYYFSKTYGDSMQNSAIRISYEPRGKNRLACSVDNQLIDAIKSAFANSKLTLKSIQPLMMSSINLWHKEIGNKSAWFLLLESNHAYLAQIDKGDWRMLHHTKWSSSAPKELLRFIQRERLSSGVGGRIILPLLVFAPGLPNPLIKNLKGWNVFHLTPEQRQGFSPNVDMPYAMPMCA